MRIAAPVLITGATGFVGGHLAETLAGRGIPVRLLVRDPKRLAFPLGKGMQVAVGDVTDADSLQSAVKGVKTVLHLAGVLKGLKFADYERVNAGGTRMLCEAMTREKSVRRLALVSSLAAAGPSERGQELIETDTARPVSFYGLSKRMGEEIALSYGKRFGVTILRPGAVYGPRDRDVLEYFKMVKMGIVTLHGDGLQEMSFVHVGDVVQAILLAAGNPKAVGRTFFVSDGKVATWGAMLDAVGEAMNTRFAVVRIPLPLVGVIAGVADLVGRIRGKSGILNLDKVKEARCPAWTCSIGEARRVLGYKPRFDLVSGVADTVKWCRANGWL